MSPPAAAHAPAGARSREALRHRYSPPGPRRVSGPARRAPDRRAVRARPGRAGVLPALASALVGVANHRLLDRLIRGRAWLIVVTFALIGIVTLQLALLKLNGAEGRALHSAALLQRENAELSIENSELSAPERVQARAAQLGLGPPASASLGFLAPTHHGDFARGAAALASPLHVPAGGSEQSASSTASGSSGEGAGAGQGEGAGGESRSREGASGEAKASEGSPSEARTSETTGSSAAPAGSETSSSQSAGSSGTAETAAAAAAPARSNEASGSGESGPGGGTPAGPNG